jgi:glycosyltransferase involved in cell wall biosynthesis
MTRRILLLLTDLEIGGTPTVVRETALRLHDPPRAAVSVACLGRWGPVADQIRARGLDVTALEARGPRDLRVIGRLAHLIHEQRFDTVLSFLMHANVAAALASTTCPGVRFLQSIQTTQAYPRWHWMMQRVSAHRAEKIVVPSPSVAEAARRWANVEEKKIVIIPNGVDLPASLPPAVPPAMPHRVVFLGRLDPIKRLPDLLTAMASLRGFARLDVFGEGSQRRFLEKQIAALDIGSSVMLHGAVAEPKSVLAGAEVLVLPSQAEGFGLVLIEAMAAGVPVVATEAPGIRDVVMDGETGLLVPVGSPAALAEAIRRVLADDSLRHRLAVAAFADVRRRFTWETAIDAYRRLFGI